jgi:hypothetical protein
MATVRVAHAEALPGKLPNGDFLTHGHLVVLADDAGHRAVPIWLGGGTDPGAEDLARLVELRDRPPEEAVSAAVPEVLTTRLLEVAGASVTGVDLDVPLPDDGTTLDPEVTVARVELTGRSGTRHVAAGLGLGLAIAVTAGAPVRMPDAVLDRLGAPVAGDDLLTPFLDRVPHASQEGVMPGRRRRTALGRGPGPGGCAARGRRQPARRAAARGRSALLRRPAGRPGRRVARRGQGQPAQGPAAATRLPHRAPP